MGAPVLCDALAPKAQWIFESLLADVNRLRRGEISTGSEGGQSHPPQHAREAHDRQEGERDGKSERNHQSAPVPNITP